MQQASHQIEYSPASPPNYRQPIAVGLSILALLLWIASLFLPVFRENGSDHPVVGYEVILFTIGWLLAIGIGLPWLFMNLGFLVLLLLNVLGKPRRGLGVAFVFATIVLTAVVVAFDQYAMRSGATQRTMMQIGVVAWTMAMLLVGVGAILGKRGLGASAS